MRCEQFAARARRSFQRTRREARGGFEPQRDVLRDGQIGKERGLLIDAGDAERVRRAGVRCATRLAVDVDACRRPADARR